ncbi:hypothetical protein B296_00048714 [Ensete ventricosum]|uniref:Retrotransposon gag domain-containing protein n=1 Tax=Ensete ventricosum TaxID=4639 RepID=A0A426YTM6_ENSVE|nr:hypothetical protein B296_00048714 [Ensete ventricosum]
MQPPKEPPRLQTEPNHTPIGDVVRRPTSTPSASTRSVPDTDTLSLDSPDSLRVQLRMVNQRIDDVHKVIKTKNEHRESPPSGSPFIPEIQDRLITQYFWLPMLEAYDRGSDPMEHVAAFRAHIAFARPKPTIASLIRMRQNEDEPLDPYLARFTKEIRAIPNLLVERPPMTMPEILQSTNQYVTAKALVAEKREDQKRPQAESSWGSLPGLPTKRTERAEQHDPKITFRFENEYPGHDDALVISARIANTHVKHIMIDTGSSADILYFDAFQKLGITLMTSTLIGFTIDAITPVGITTLPMTFDEELRTKTLVISFMVVELPSAYNMIIDRSTLNKLRAIVSTYHRSIKFPTNVRVGEVKSDPW